MTKAMTIRTIFLLLIIASLCAEAQTILDPVRDVAELGRTYLVWKVDINHDDVVDVLVSEKPTAAEIQDMRAATPLFPSDFCAFAVYAGSKNGNGYNKAGGIGIEMSRCYVGYVKQIHGYGVVSLDTTVVDDPKDPNSKYGIPEKQVCCYDLKAGKIEKTALTPWLDDWENNAIYRMYLTESKRTNVHPQEVTPAGN